MRVINIFNLVRLKNAPHVQFHNNVSSLVTAVGISKLPFAQLYALYQTALDNEKESLLLITKSEITAVIVERDGKRDATFRGFADVVKGYRNHFDPDKQHAAERLWHLFQHYGNLARQSFDAETAAINDFLKELKKPEIASEVTTLKLTDWVEQLTLTNTEFNEATMARFCETTNRTTFRMKTARVETDKYYRAIVSSVENIVLIGGTLPADLQHFITELNAIVAHYKHIVAQEQGRKKNAIDN